MRPGSDRSSVLTRGTPESLLSLSPPQEDSEKVLMCSQDEGSHQQDLNLGLPASRPVGNKCMLLVAEAAPLPPVCGVPLCSPIG